MSAAIEVVAQRELWAGQGLDGGQRGERHWFAIPVAHVEQSKVFGFGAKFALSLNIDLPLAAKPVEIIYESAAHKRLERFINFAKVHALFQRLVAIHVHEDLRHHRQERGAQAGQLGAFAGRFEELAQVAIEELDILPGAILQDEGEAACRANPLNGRGGKRERHRLRKSRELAVHVRLDGIELFLGFPPLAPVFECHPKKGAVGVPNAAKQAEACNRREIFYTRCLVQNLLDVPADGVGALHGRGERKLHLDEHVTLVFLGQEPPGQLLAKPACREGDNTEERQAEGRLSNQPGAQAHVSFADAAVNAIESAKKFAERAGRFLSWPQQQGRKCRTESERIERGEEHRDGNGHRELLIEPAGDARNEDGWQKHRCQNNGDRHDGPGNFFHRFESRLSGRESFFDVMFDRLHDHDRIVHDQADGQHKPKERERVDGKTQQREDREGPDERNGHGQHRNQRCPPPL